MAGGHCASSLSSCARAALIAPQTARDVMVAEVEVGKEPNTMVVDKNGHVWVLCEGRSWDAAYGEQPSLWEIDPMLKTAQRRYEFDGTAQVLKSNPAGDQFYMIYNNEVRRFDLSSVALSEISPTK